MILTIYYSMDEFPEQNVHKKRKKNAIKPDTEKF